MLRERLWHQDPEAFRLRLRGRPTGSTLSPCCSNTTMANCLPLTVSPRTSSFLYHILLGSIRGRLLKSGAPRYTSQPVPGTLCKKRSKTLKTVPKDTHQWKTVSHSGVRAAWVKVESGEIRIKNAGGSPKPVVLQRASGS